MTLPTTVHQHTPNDDDSFSDMFGPSPPVRRNRPKVPMISAQMRLREVRKRILQLCVHKLENIKDSERNLRRSVCINNTYSRLTDEIRREKQNKHHMLNSYSKSDKKTSSTSNSQALNNNNENLNNNSQQMETNCNNRSEENSASCRSPRRSSSVDVDLETLDRELCALDAHMPLVDPEITQGAEQLEQAMVSRKRKASTSEEENDRLVREALSQFYMPSTRLLSAIDDCPLLVSDCKRQKTDSLDLDLNTLDANQKEFECIIDALRSSTSSSGIDSCGQAAMMGESGSVFHNLVVASLET